jgi:hypothetical protein
MPSLCAFGSWRKIGTFRILAGEAEAHRDDGEAGLIVELPRIDAHPVAQAVAGRIGEGNA